MMDREGRPGRVRGVPVDEHLGNRSTRNAAPPNRSSGAEDSRTAAPGLSSGNAGKALCAALPAIPSLPFMPLESKTIFTK